jgi:hypothetical protein
MSRHNYRVTISFEVIPYQATEGRWRDLLDQRVPALAFGLGSYRELNIDVEVAEEGAE